jgi:hypothetical protein
VEEDPVYIGHEASWGPVHNFLQWKDMLYDLIQNLDGLRTDNKENKFSLIFKKFSNGAVAQSSIYEEGLLSNI